MAEPSDKTLRTAPMAPGRGSPGSGPAGGGEPITDRIRKRAYEIFRARMGGPGDPLSDWLRAEREVLGESRTGPVAARPAVRRRGPAAPGAIVPSRAEVLR